MVSKGSVFFFLFSTLLMAGVVSSGTGTAAAQRGLPALSFKVGEPFPNLALPSLQDGRPKSIADFRGKKLILHIFASW